MTAPEILAAFRNLLDAIDGLSPEERKAVAAQLTEDAEKCEGAADVFPAQFKPMTERAYALRRMASLADPPSDEIKSGEVARR
jgi:hypothetical protein